MVQLIQVAKLILLDSIYSKRQIHSQEKPSQFLKIVSKHDSFIYQLKAIKLNRLVSAENGKIS